MKKSKGILALLVVVANSLFTNAAMAVSVVDAAVTAQIAETQTDITTVGTAIIGLAVIALAIRWVKATFF